tara:strand:+ start:693 stop:2351 length:1659 start_codon:yes stop_codon:yes gene_type:complete
MQTKDSYFKIKATVEEKGFTLCRPVPSDSKCDAVFDGRLAVGHTKVDVRLEVPDYSFVVHPRVRLRDITQMPTVLVSHIETDEGICYSTPGLLRLDPYDPGGSILLVLQLAKAALERSLAGNAVVDIADEFAAYWKGAPVELIASTKQDGRLQLALPLSKTSAKPILLMDSGRSVPSGYECGRSAYLMRSDKLLQPADNFIAPSDLVALEAWYKGQDLAKRVAWQKLRERLAKCEIVFLAASNAIVGMSLDLPGDVEALRKKEGSVKPSLVEGAMKKRPTSFSLIRYVASDAQLETVVKRNMEDGAGSLIGKRVALVGCGTIGSHLARQLAQLGAGCEATFDLIDPEILSASNIGRHLLDFRHIGQPKAEALANELSEFHPDLNVQARLGRADAFVPILRQADLIIDATGIEHVAEDLNRRKLTSDSFPPIVHVWLFGNGIAAQAFANLGSVGKACYRCLRPRLSEPWRFDPRKDVFDPGHAVSGTCGDGVFLPYGVYASTSAASLGAQLVHDWASASPTPLLRTRVIDPDRAKILSGRSPDRDPTCPACSQ